MPDLARSQNSNRPLTDGERRLVRWMLSNGAPEALEYLPQLERAEVTPDRCPCGCASFDFQIRGRPKASPGVHILGDFLYGGEDDLCGIFVFASNGILSGVEVTGYASDAPKRLPIPEELRPFRPATINLPQ